MERQSLLDFALRARSQAVFACSEICKGLAIVGIGDMIVAEELGELVTVLVLMAQNSPLRSPTHRRASRCGFGEGARL